MGALANGAYSSNGDLGNLAHDSGEAFSTQISGNHELDIRYGDIGFLPGVSGSMILSKWTTTVHGITRLPAIILSFATIQERKNYYVPTYVCWTLSSMATGGLAIIR